MARQPLQIRLSEVGIRRLDEVAADWQTTRSDVIRLILGDALVNRELLGRLKARAEAARTV